MSLAGWLFAWLGLILATMTNMSILWDIYALHCTPRLPTVSGWVYFQSQQHPILWGTLLGTFLFGTALALWVHLFLGVGVDES